MLIQISKIRNNVQRWFRQLDHLVRRRRLYYIRDTRGFIGNNVIFWGKNSGGYTGRLDDAGVYEEEEAMRIHKNRETDVPVEKKQIDKYAHKFFDMQDWGKITPTA